jgi:hypothetical protein
MPDTAIFPALDQQLASALAVSSDWPAVFAFSGHLDLQFA